ncbi:MAG: hypothetical protein WD533_08920 [Dehalococcoidia bacterium]
MHDAHHQEFAEAPTHREVVHDVLARFQDLGPRYWGWITVLAFLSLLGAVGIVIRLTGGFDERANWGYLAATMSFILSTFMALPIISAGLRLAKAHWRRPFTRVAENMAVSGIVMTILMFFALAALPPLEGRLNIWFDFPMGAPGVWNFLGFGGLAFTGLLFLWTVALPDLATARDHLPPSGRQRVISVLSLGWTGHLRQWRVLRMGALTLGAFFMMYYPLTQTLMVSDFHAGLLPGWKDAIFPATQVVAGLQGAAALLLVIMYLMRKMGYEQYFSLDQFWSLAKPLLAFSLLWFYFWWASFISFWYGRMPGETALMQYLMLETYRIPMMLGFLLNFIGPLIALIWNPVRKSIWGPALVGAGILLGTFITQVRLFVSAYAVEDPTPHVLEPLPAAQLPGAPDFLIMLGALSSCVLLFMLVSKLIPVVSIWEVTEGLHLVKVRKFFGRYVRVIAKSH